MKILVLSPISPLALERLGERHSVELAFNDKDRPIPAWAQGDTEIIILRSGVYLDRSHLDRMSCLRAVIRAGSGVDNLDIEYLANRGIPVFNVPKYHANSVAELTMALLFALARQIVLADRRMRAGVWAKRECIGTELRGKTVGIIGLGLIGCRLATLCQHMEMNVVGTVLNYSSARQRDFGRSGIHLVERMEEVASDSDFVTLHVPLSPRSHKLIGTEFFASMKPSAYFINIARGGVVDEDALDQALLNKQIAGAGLDVHESEGTLSRFYDRDNVILTPHLGSSTHETQEKIGEEVICLVDRISAERESSQLAGC